MNDNNKIPFSINHFLHNNYRKVETLFLKLYESYPIPKQNNKQKKKCFKCLLANFMWANFNNKPISIYADRNKYTKEKTNGKFTQNDLEPMLKALESIEYINKKNGFYDKKSPELSFPRYFEIKPEFKQYLNTLTNNCMFTSKQSNHLILIKEPKIIVCPNTLKILEEEVQRQNDFMSNFSVISRGFNLSKRFFRSFKYNLRTGGRFYYKNLSPQHCSKETRRDIRIDKHPTIELDYSSYHTNICYSLIGMYKALKNAYYLLGIPKDLVKAVLTRIYYCRSIVSLKESLKKTDKEEKFKYSKLLKECGLNWNKLIGIIEEKHKLIKKFFYTGFWGRLQNKDSIIAGKIMKTLREKYIPCLCIHDSFITPIEFKDILRKTMEREYYDITRQRNIPIKVN